MTTERSRPRNLPFAGFWSTDRSLTVLLFSLIVAIFVIYPLGDLGIVGDVLLTTFFSLILISGVVAVAKRRGTAILAGGVALAALLVRWTHLLLPAAHLRAWDAVGSLLSCGLLAAIVLAQAYREGPITLQRIEGAIAAYILVGLMFAFAYELFVLARPTAFNFPSRPVDGSTHAISAQLVYFSFVTLTTLGYGDVTAVDPLARSLTTFEALIGQIFPAVTLARLVSMELYYRQQRRDGKGQ
jgi:hypothetical protein